jgi:hypothetical protein
VGGYSDFFVVPNNALKRFAHLCGIFASMNVFTEIAIPTALSLCSDKCRHVLPDNFQDGALWGQQIEDFCHEYDFSLAKLFENFPKDKLYVHPVKLSLWKRGND